MDAWRAKSLLESSRTVWVIGAVILCFFALTNLPWQLDDYDQAQQAFTSFEMIKEGHWFFQRTPHARAIWTLLALKEWLDWVATDIDCRHLQLPSISCARTSRYEK